MSTETYEATTTEEWQAGREAMDEYEERLRTAPTSCQLFEEMLSSFDNDVRVQSSIFDETHMDEKFRIAIIDDNPDAAGTIAEYSRKLGMTTQFFGSCEELLASDQNFDAVVTDTALGWNMNGFDCALNIRSLFPTAVIVGTSVVDPERNDEYRKIYQRWGADDFINRREGDRRIAQRVLELLNQR